MRAFVCKPLNGARLSRDACGVRSKALRASGPRGLPRAVGVACVRCSVGRDHARGHAPTTWPDGSPIELVEITRVVTVAHVLKTTKARKRKKRS